jgi:hypothetical protein
MKMVHFSTLPLRYSLLQFAYLLQFHKNVPATKERYIAICHMASQLYHYVSQFHIILL